MPGLKTIDPPIQRALRRAIAYCHTMFEAEMSVVAPGTATTPSATAWRVEATEYQRLLRVLEPRKKKVQAAP